jgi:hypothetical protein
VSKSFFTLLELLVKNNVNFVIIGGFAGIVHGCTYVTQDVDICCEFSVPNLLKLAQALKSVHPIHRMTPARLKLELDQTNAAQFKNLYLDTDIGQLDCLSFVEGVGEYRKARENSLLIEVEGIKMRVLNLEAFIESKKALNRPRDRMMIEQAKKIKKARGKP